MARILLFCLPYAGGSAMRVYGRWQQELPDPIQVVPVELAGRGARIVETPLTSVDAITQDVIGTLLDRIDRPYAIFGHSLGALVAFELARRLEHLHGRPASHLFVSGHRAPQLPHPMGQYDYRLPDAEFKERLRELAGTPDEVLAHEELLDLVLPILRADFEAADTYRYRPGPRMSCPMTVCGGTDDPEAPPDTLPDWSALTAGPCEVRVLPGQHFFLHEEQATLLKGIAADLEPAPPPAPAENGRTP
ncbi:Surfactin synthase thioesterase subunit [Micromonospora viridifaciens]|uniref:Surfactin synthase thioesterase subunit n=1 Tax=Micromonospora viridifaciens TaxID=1881 RepID=A0A1C4WVW4_MICVI|nr:alpha/beta fold hydrolase [Micromonospora viridifaciens]SCF00011.1 Surfactin synthase thioesterase subunit [Micromonospora viridifaciens]